MENNFIWTDDVVLEFLSAQIPKAANKMVFNYKEMVDDFKRSKERKLLFITQDGISVYEKDKFYTVTDSFEVVMSDAVRGIHITTQIISRSFYTPDAANEYILMNKPCLSVRDIHQKLKLWYGMQLPEVKDEVINLAKSKING